MRDRLKFLFFKSSLRNLNFILGIILLLGFFIQISIYKYPVDWDDANRDYMVARHIVVYKEYPLVGYTSAVAGIKNSPVYFYFLALLVAIRDDPYFLGVVNIVLHTLTAFIIYKLAKEMYGEKEGLLVAALFSINPIALYQSIHILQPWLMQPLVNLSYFLLFLSYNSKNFKMLLASAIIFISACVFHNSTFAVAPIFIAVSFYLLKEQKARIFHYASYIVTFLATLLLYYTPLLLYLFKNSSMNIPLPKLQLLSVEQISVNAVNNLFHFITTSFFYPRNDFLSIYILPLAIICLVSYYFFHEKSTKQKKHSYIIVGAIISFILFASFVDLRVFTRNYFYYFTPILGLLMVLFGRSVVFIFKKHSTARLILMIIGIAYIVLFSIQYLNHYTKIKHFPSTDPGADAIEKEVLLIKENKNLKDFNFFQIVSFVEEHGWRLSATFWMPLEREFHTKFVRVSDEDVRSFEEIQRGDTEYVFLICPNFSQIKTACPHNFLTENNNYAHDKIIFSNLRYTILLLTKTN